MYIINQEVIFIKDIYIRNNNLLQKLEVDEIFYFAKREGKVIAVTKENRWEIDGTLYYISELLGKNSNFFRCHKSFIVNTKKIRSIENFNNKTYNINFTGINDQAYITQKNLRIFEQRIALL
jgi:two-component system, LytTR family, response regulator